MESLAYLLTFVLAASAMLLLRGSLEIIVDDLRWLHPGDVVFVLVRFLVIMIIIVAGARSVAFFLFGLSS